MKRIVVLMGLILCLSSLGFSQPGGRFYGFVAPAGQVRSVGESPTAFGFGVAGMYLGSRGFGGGAELAVVGPRKHTDDRNNWNKDSVGLFTLNGIKVFNLGDKFEAFGTSGYGRTFMRGSGANWWELSGGVNYWFHEKLGFTFELRDYIHRQDKHDWWQYWTPRLGMTWRD